MTDSRRTLVIAAHPDDEVLGAGGWMAKYPGCLVAIISEGTSAQPPNPFAPAFEDRLLAKRQATKEALALVAAECVYEGMFLDQQLAVTLVGLHAVVTSLLEQHQPATVLTHSPYELNADHRVVSEVVSVACRPFTQVGQRLHRLLAFSVDMVTFPGGVAPGPATPTAQVFCALTSAQMDQKMDAIGKYRDELRLWPHPRSMRGIRTYHRHMGAIAGTNYAEPYTLLWGRV